MRQKTTVRFPDHFTRSAFYNYRHLYPQRPPLTRSPPILSMQAVQDALNCILTQLPQLLRKNALDEHVADVLASLEQNVPLEARKTYWEFVLRQELFTLAVCTVFTDISEYT